MSDLKEILAKSNPDWRAIAMDWEKRYKQSHNAAIDLAIGVVSDYINNTGSLVMYDSALTNGNIAAKKILIEKLEQLTD